MRRRRATSRKPAKAQQKIKAKRGTASKPARNRRVTALSKDTKIARLARELAEAREQQAATSELLKVIGRSTLDLQPVFETLAENAVRLCEAKRSFIYRFDGQYLRVVATYNASPELRAFVEQNPIAPGRGSATARAALERRTVQVLDAQGDPEYTYGSRQADPFRTIITVPILKGNELFGAIGIYRHEVRAFTESQISLLETFADQALIAIENVRLFDDVQARTRDLSESLQQQTATADVLKVISRSTFNLQSVLDTLVELAARLCEAERAIMFRREGSIYKSAAYYGYSREFREYHESHSISPGRGTAVGRTAVEGKTVNIPDVLADPEYTFLEAQKLGQYRANLAVPLLREGKPIGAFSLTRREPLPFNTKQIELVETFADQAVIAIENVRLFEEVQNRTRELTEALEQQTSTSEVLRVISSSPGELGPVFQTMLESATRVCEAKFGVMFYYLDGALRPAAQLNVPAAYSEFIRQRGSYQPVAGSTFEQLIRTRQIIHLPDAAAEGPFFSNNAAKLGGARTYIAVPMLKENELVGAIAIYRQEVRPFTDKQIELVSNFAKQAVIAIENTRLLNELREIAAAADRHRRRAQGHQPLDLRSANGARYACRVSGTAL